MNISLPDTLKSFVDEQVSQRGFGTSSEYVRELIRKGQERLQVSDSRTPAIRRRYFAGHLDARHPHLLFLRAGQHVLSM